MAEHIHYWLVNETSVPGTRLFPARCWCGAKATFSGDMPWYYNNEPLFASDPELNDRIRRAMEAR